MNMQMKLQNFKNIHNKIISDAYILVKETISAASAPPLIVNPNNDGKEELFKNCASFTDCLSKINNIQKDNAKYIDLVMPLCNLIEYVDNYSQTSASL